MAAIAVPERTQAVVDAVSECMQSCNACAFQCCMPGGNYECARLCLDTAAFAQLCVTLLSRGSPRAGEFCRLMAEVCDACANSCESCAMELCVPCAEVCRRCAAACREYAQASA